MRLKAAELSYEWSKSGEFKNKEGDNVLDAKLTSWNKKPKIYDGEFDIINKKILNLKQVNLILWI